jgi:DNA ligase (NAD+)
MKKIKDEIKKLRREAEIIKERREEGEIVNKYVEYSIYNDLVSIKNENLEIFKEVIKEEIEELRKEVIKHDKLYSENNPVITDSEYDKLYMKLVLLEENYPEFYDKNSPTQKITATVVDSLRKVRHAKLMLSQQKINSKEEIIDFVKKGDEVLVQEKLDGITLVLKYKDGKLVEAVSRGDGEIGEDLYHNAVHFKSIPKTISDTREIYIRTEAVLPFEEFEKLNTDGKYSNPRNLVSGSLRQLDSSKVMGKGFKAIAFDLIITKDEEFNLDSEKLEYMEKLGFEVVNSTLMNKTDEIISYIDKYEHDTRSKLDYMIDGMVLKFNDLKLREEMGYTSKHPRWATAYKFKSLDATTKLLGITDQVGKTGQITPVAELETVNIDGVNISRATLHNYDNIKTKDIRIGDTVLVARANDVIPQIIKTIKDLRTGTEIIKSPPKRCPICNSLAKFEGANLYCTGINCTPQLEGKIKHFAKRDAMNIDGLGEKTIEEFFKKGIITSIVDIYDIKNKKEEVLKLEGFGETKFEKIVKGIEDSKNRELRNFIYGLSIKNIGRSASRDLANEFKSMKNILKASEDEKTFRERLLTVGIFGEIMSQNLIDFLAEEANKDVIKKLMDLKLNTELQEKSQDEAENSSIKNKTFVVTGKVFKFKNRKELQSKIEELGGKVTGSVSSNTDYLINNDIKSNSSKNKKAKKLNIPILSEESFLKMLS